MRKKTYPTVTLSTTNPTSTRPGFRGQRLAANRLSHVATTSDYSRFVSAGQMYMQSK
jgi:hypothetical protein